MQKGEKMVREFFIENDLGQQFSMMDIENYCFLNSPTGLGYSYNTEYSQIGDEFIQNIRKLAQGQIGGELIFKSYDNYKNFIDFIESSNFLKFVYKVPFENGLTEYFKDIDISNIDKTEISPNGVLVVPATFTVKSLWYEQKNIVLTVEAQSGEIRWDFVWDSRFVDYSIRNLVFENKGHAEAPIKLEINGYVENPAIQIIDNNGNEKSLELPVIIDTGEKLIYSTRDTDLYIVKVDANGVETNLFDCINPNFINFIKLSKGVNQIKITANEDITSATLTIYVEYKAV